MKKWLIVIFSFIALTGCGKKTLHCSMINDANKELKITQNIITRFQNNSMVEMDMRIIQDLSDNYASYADDIAKSLKEQYKKYENKEGIKFDIKNEGKKVVLTLTADLNKIDDQTKNQLDIAGNGQKIEDVKLNLEQQGYTCKGV